MRTSANDVPEIIPGGEDFCLTCGHCIAVCPHGALRHSLIPLEECPAIDKALIINDEQAAQFLRSRRSIRFFKDKPVEKEKIRKLIEIGRYAPTASNTQLVEWLVLTDTEKINDIARQTVDWMRSAMEKNPDSPQASYLPMIIAACT